MSIVSRFHYITQDVSGFSHPELAMFACCGGAEWVQLRIKNKSFKEWLSIAKETQSVCKKYGAKLIINDHVGIAKEIEADGVHLGNEDMAPEEARKILGNNSIIGGSANTIEDIKRHAENGCDYVGIGPYRHTLTKEKLNPVLGLEGIKKIMEQRIHKNISIPVIAIGGIRLENVKSLMKTGVRGIAVSSAINLSDSKTNETKKFIMLCTG